MTSLKIFKSQKRLSFIMLIATILFLTYSMYCLFVHFLGRADSGSFTFLISGITNGLLAVIFLFQAWEMRKFGDYFIKTDQRKIQWFLPGMEEPDELTKTEFEKLETSWKGVEIHTYSGMKNISFKEVPHTERKQLLDGFRLFTSS